MWSKIKHELKAVGIITLYFLTCFWVIVLLRSLFLEQYHIDVYGYAAAAIGALMIAKVVLILNATNFGKRFSKSYPYLHILYSSVVYTFWTFILVVIEHTVSAYRSAEGFQVAFLNRLHELDWHIIAAKTLCVGITFIIFFTLVEINKLLGNDGLKRFFLTKKQVNS